MGVKGLNDDGDFVFVVVVVFTLAAFFAILISWRMYKRSVTYSTTLKWVVRPSQLDPRFSKTSRLESNFETFELSCETGRQNDFRAINFLFYSLSSSILEFFKLRVETVDLFLNGAIPQRVIAVHHCQLTISGVLL